MHKSLQNTLLSFLLLAIPACSSPTSPLTEDAVLELLSLVPPIPSPSATASNQDSVGWQITTMKCEQATFYLPGYLRIYENLPDSPGLSFSKSGDEYIWRFTPFVVEEYELTVQVKERLVYTIRILHEDYQDYWYSGWVSRSGKAGSINWNHISGPIWSYEWWQEGKNQVHRWEMYGQQGEDSIEIRGQSDGSGNLRSVRESSWEAPHIFEATWGALGHGTSTAGDW